MNAKNFAVLTVTFTILSVMYAPNLASASLLGDEVTIAINGVFGNNPTTTTVGPGVEATYNGQNGPCVPPGEQVRVDIDASQIWIAYEDFVSGPFFMCDDNSNVIDPIIITITDMDWVGQPGFITDIVGPTGDCTAFISAQVLGPHSVEIIHSGNFEASGQPVLSECHFELVTNHAVDGALLPISTTALFLAGMQTSAIWLIPSVVGIAGVGFYLVRAKFN